MSLLDRHIAWAFLKTFAICFVSFAGLFVVIDAFQNLDSFLEYGREHGQLFSTMLKYYFYRSLMMFEMMAPLVTLVAAMFTVAGLQRWNEMTALMAAGLPKRRILRPVLAGTVALSLGTALAREVYLPRVRNEPGLGRNVQDLTGNERKDLTPLVDDQTGVWFNGAGSLLAEQTIVSPQLKLPRSLSPTSETIQAADALYLASSPEHPAGYLLRKVSGPNSLLLGPSLELPDYGKVVITRQSGATWLQADQLFVVSQITFEQLTGGAIWRKYGALWELIAGLRNPALQLNEGVEIAVHLRLLQPLLDISLVFLGLPLMLGKERGGVWLALGRCILLVVAFVSVQQVGQYLAQEGIVSASLGVWLPLLIFGPIACLTSEPLWEWNDEPRSRRFASQRSVAAIG